MHKHTAAMGCLKIVSGRYYHEAFHLDVAHSRNRKMVVDGESTSRTMSRPVEEEGIWASYHETKAIPGQPPRVPEG